MFHGRQEPDFHIQSNAQCPVFHGRQEPGLHFQYNKCILYLKELRQNYEVLKQNRKDPAFAANFKASIETLERIR